MRRPPPRHALRGWLPPNRKRRPPFPRAQTASAAAHKMSRSARSSPPILLHALLRRLMAQAISSLGLLLPRINAVPMRRRHYGHGKAQALRWQHFSPGSDQLLVSAAHSADVAAKFIQPQWIDVAVLRSEAHTSEHKAIMRI